MPHKRDTEASSGLSTACYLDKLHAKAPKDVIKLELSMAYGAENKYVTVHFDPHKFPKQIEIVHITDVQFGHLCCNVQKFIEYCDWILEVPYRFVVLGGDMVDAATVISIASPYENTEEPQGQVYKFAEIAVRIRHRIIGYVGGNHERRGVKTFGDLGKLIATLLKVPYSAGLQILDIHYGDHNPFRISLWHGTGNAKTKGAKTQMMDRFLKEQTSSNVCMVGHLHDVLMAGAVRMRPDKGTIHLDKCAVVMSSSFLDFWGTYAEVAGLPPSDTQMWRVVLEPRAKKHTPGWMLTLRAVWPLLILIGGALWLSRLFYPSHSSHPLVIAPIHWSFVWSALKTKIC
jgi:hypothetical protein